MCIRDRQAAVETEADGKTRLTFPPVVEGEEAAPLFELKKVQYSQALGLVTHFKNNSKHAFSLCSLVCR